MSDREKASLRSQSGAGTGTSFSTSPTCFLTRIEPPFFRVLLLRGLRLPLPLTQRSCQCGRTHNSCGHHRAACARSGVLGRRGFAVENAAARISREGGACVMSNITVRDLDVARPDPRDRRRLEIVADNLPLFGGRQLAVDTTLVSSLNCDGSAQPRATNMDGAAMEAARQRKSRTYPEFVGPRGSAPSGCACRLCWRPMVGGN